MKLAAVFLVLAGLVHMNSAKAALWMPVLTCSNNKLEIDLDRSATPAVYKLVLRDAGAVSRFVQITQDKMVVSRKGELTVAVKPVAGSTNSLYTVSPISQSQNGYSTNLSAVLDTHDGLNLYIIGNGPSGPEKIDLWYFKDCQKIYR